MMTRKNKNIYVTRPFLPPIDEFLPYLEDIWANKHLTNVGPYHQQFEMALADYLGVEYISLFTNGTIALVTALQALRIRGEVITTPYSFVATSHSLVWNDIKPVFVDIDPGTLNLDPKEIEAAITAETTAILPVHVYGRSCAVEEIQEVADRYNLKVIYDAAHAFGVTHKGQSLLHFGDLSVLSFHATKVFNTFEGGAIVCHDSKTKEHIDHLKNFGFVDETTVVAPGINGKMHEFSAALGLLQLKYADQNIRARHRVDSFYREQLKAIAGIRCLLLPPETESNFAYFPVIVEDNYPLRRDDLYEKLKREGIYVRRYFYPLISEFPPYRNSHQFSRNSLLTALDISERILCLPIYPGIELRDIERVIEIIKRA